MTEDPLPDALFEISWEVCNKVGGIHTVLHSKAPFVARAYAGRVYALVGPLNARSRDSFEECAPSQEFRAVIDAMRQRGIPCSYGGWRGVTGMPTVILVDFRSLFADVNGLKHRLWERYGIDSLNARFDYDEPLCFATAAGMLVEEYARQHGGRVVAQCHEWMAGFAILHLRANGAGVGTVFTTHATMLGRTIEGSGNDLYGLLDDQAFDPRSWAYRLGVQEKHLTEVACVREADIFTAVSDLTSREAARILGRPADIVTRNGYHVERIPSFSETTMRHETNRDFLRALCAALWTPTAPFDPDRTLILLTSGRYEIRNKGIDVTIRALGKLNERLRAAGSSNTVVFLCLLIRERGPVKRLALERWGAFARSRTAVEWVATRLLQRAALDLLAGKSPGDRGTLTETLLADLHANAAVAQKMLEGLNLTHDIADESTDPILAAFAEAGLRNRPEDSVKVLYVPGFLDGTDGLINLPYEDVLVGAHLGVFPSRYEPWGYTPHESAMLGVPTITTDAAGFGQHAKTLAQDGGIFILPRIGVTDDAFVTSLADSLTWFAGLDQSERVRHGITAKRIAESCEWSSLVAHHLRAHTEAYLKRGL